MTDTGLAETLERSAVTQRPDIPRSEWAARRERWPDPQSILRKLGIEAGTSVVDVGAGAGFFSLPAADVVAPAPVYVIHPDGTLLDELEAAALDGGLDNVETVSGRASELAALLPERVDAVLVVSSFHSLSAPTAFAEQVSRSLNPGGRLVVVEWREEPTDEGAPGGEEPHAPSAADRLALERLASLVAPAGLEVALEVDLPPHHYGLVFKRGHDR